MSTFKAVEAMLPPGAAFWRAALLVLLVIPWVNPFAIGPSPAVMSWLVAAGCALLLWMLPGRIDPDLMANALLASSLLSAAMAVSQYFGWADDLSPWVNSTGVGQAFGNLRQRNQFASLMTLGLAALLYMNRIRHLRWQGMLMLCLLAVGLACSASRTGLVQWLLVLLLAWLWRRPGSWRTVAPVGIALLAYVLAVAALPILLREWHGVENGGVIARLASESVDCASRITLWSNVLQLISQRPWFGWGLGELDYAHYVTLYPRERFCDILDNAHNLPLHLAVEWGVPAALLVFALLIWTVLRSRPWAQAQADRQMAWTVLALLAVHSLLEYPLWYGPFQIAAIWCIWHLWRRSGTVAVGQSGRASQDISAGAAPRVAVGLVGLAICSYAGWDYHRVSQIYLLPEQRSERYRADTMAKVKESVLFRSQVEFAELAITPLTRANAERVRQLALGLLHFSPEARVIERLIESSILLGRREEAMFHLARYRRAFPAEQEQWSRKLALRGQRQAASAPTGAPAATTSRFGS